MKLVIDTNIIISAIVKDSLTRKVLLSSYFEFYTPDIAFQELERHSDLLIKKTDLDHEKLVNIIELIKDSVNIVRSERFDDHISIAFDEMRCVDESDAPFLALALSFSNDGIWSNDKHFQRQELVKCWTTQEMLEVL